MQWIESKAFSSKVCTVENFSKLISANLLNASLIYSTHDYECFTTGFMNVLQKLWNLDSIITLKSPFGIFVFLSKSEIVPCVS